jgi:FixJ family two-component response regulator
MSAADHESIIVAVIDDDRASRESVCAVIESIGYSTVAFESGENFAICRDRTAWSWTIDCPA